jgi:hypothetical protein
MKQLVAAGVTLTAIVAGIVVATSLSSAAQEDDGSGDTTTTTVVGELEFSGRFGFRFDGELPPELADLADCLTEEGIEIPEDLDGGFLFELKNEEGLAAALEACGLPAFGDGFPFMDGHPFDGELLDGFPFKGEFPGLADLEACLTEEGIEIPEDLDRGFLFELDEEDIEGLAEALEACGLPSFVDGFAFDGEFPEGFPFGGEGFEFHFGGPALDLDELATCLADLGSFDSVDQVREQLETCLPTPIEFGDLGGFHDHHGRGGFGFPFGGHGPFGFDLDDDAPDLEGTSS